MARQMAKRKTRPKGIADFSGLVTAWRYVTGEPGDGMKVKQTMECRFGKMQSGKFYAKAVGDDFKVRVSGWKKDIVGRMFDSALRSAGWRLIDGT